MILKILSINKILTSIKSHNSVENEQKIQFDHPNLHLININTMYVGLRGWRYDMVHDMGIATHNTVRTFYKILYPILKGIHNGNTKYYHAQ